MQFRKIIFCILFWMNSVIHLTSQDRLCCSVLWICWLEDFVQPCNLMLWRLEVSHSAIVILLLLKQQQISAQKWSRYYRFAIDCNHYELIITFFEYMRYKGKQRADGEYPSLGHATFIDLIWLNVILIFCTSRLILINK